MNTERLAIAAAARLEGDVSRLRTELAACTEAFDSRTADLRHLVELATSELRDLARSGWSAVAERHAIELARDIDEELARLIEGKERV